MFLLAESLNKPLREILRMTVIEYALWMAHFQTAPPLGETVRALAGVGREDGEEEVKTIEASPEQALTGIGWDT